MKQPNRDLLILLKQELMSTEAIEHEVDLLHNLLAHVEKVDNFIVAHEVIDLNKLKIIKSKAGLKDILRYSNLKRFTF